MTYELIEGWERRSGVRLAPHELEWIFELDRMYLTASAPAPKDRDAAKGKRR